MGYGGFALCVTAVGLAISVSTFVIIAPSGIGVREFLIAAALVAVGIPFGAGFGLAFASRLLVTVADVLAAAAAALASVQNLRERRDGGGGVAKLDDEISAHS
jgi:hypothetical protein